MKLLKKKLLLLLLSLLLAIAPVISTGCKDDDSDEVDWAMFIFLTMALYYEYGINPDQFKSIQTEPQQLAKLNTPSGSNKTDITNKGAGAGGGTGAGAAAPAGGNC